MIEDKSLTNRRATVTQQLLAARQIRQCNHKCRSTQHASWNKEICQGVSKHQPNSRRLDMTLLDAAGGQTSSKGSLFSFAIWKRARLLEGASLNENSVCYMVIAYKRIVLCCTFDDTLLYHVTWNLCRECGRATWSGVYSTSQQQLGSSDSWAFGFQKRPANPIVQGGFSWQRLVHQLCMCTCVVGNGYIQTATPALYTI